MRYLSIRCLSIRWPDLKILSSRDTNSQRCFEGKSDKKILWRYVAVGLCNLTDNTVRFSVMFTNDTCTNDEL